MQTQNLKHHVDAVVVGSGLGGMAAALSMYEMGITDILIVEKDPLYGGCSSIGAGGLWIPNNHYAKSSDSNDSFDEATEYLNATTPDDIVSSDMQRVYLENAPKMLRFLTERTCLEYESLEHYPDYFSAAPGAKTGHRSLEPLPLDITQLENRGKELRPTHHMLSLANKIYFTQKEAQVLVGQEQGWFKLAFKLVSDYLLDIRQRLRTSRSRRATCGAAGIARAAMSIQQREIPLWLATEMTDLIHSNGKVTGISVLKNGKALNIVARKGVILASGGFEHNQVMREKYLPQPTSTSWSSGHKGNTGLPIEKAIEIGADTRAMDGAWWCTTMRVPGEPSPRLSIMEKSYPGSCVVNKDGNRIANESMNYLMYVQACYDAKKKGTSIDELWLVFDARFRRSYICGPLLTSKLMPDALLPKKYFDKTYLVKANSLQELSTATGINPEGLRNTIEKMNQYAVTGDDLEFQRGSFAYDRYYGDPKVSPNNCLAPIKEAPFYAIRLYLGEFGTHGGLLTNANGQVQHRNGGSIAGLYANGNCSAPILPSYSGPGSTLGPALCFAYQAAKHIAQYDDSHIEV